MRAMDEARSLRVLLVDDSIIVRERLEALVSAIVGVRVVGRAEDAHEAIAAIGEVLPDVVLLDIRLRNSNGIDVLRHVTSESPSVKVIVLSNESAPATRAFFMRAGAHAFFDKAMEFEQLCDAIADLRGAIPPP